MKLWRLILIAAFATLPSLAMAHGDEHVSTIDSNIHVSKQNVVDVTETIKYDFGDEAHHGIYRVIPTIYPERDANNYYLEFTLQAASMDGASVPVDKRGDGKGNVSLKLGDPDATVTGEHIYSLHYQLSPVVIQKDEVPLLILDIVGTGWEVEIDRATATLNFDEGVQMSDAHCYTGAQGSTNQNCKIIPGSPASFTALNLEPNQGMTVSGTLPSGYVDHYLTANILPPVNKDTIWAYIGVIGGVLLTVVIGSILFGRWWRARRRRKRQTVIPEYDPPDGLTPGEIGLLDDDSTNMREITAILIDLAVRGYIKIIQTSPKKLMSKAQYRVEKLKDFGDARPYEQSLLGALFGGKQMIDIKDVDTTTMSATVTSVKKQLKDGLSDRGYYGIAQVEKGLLNKIMNGGALSDAGAKEWARVAGFKLYLSTVEQDRLKFTDAPDKTPERFNKLLPYAVALGVEEEWAKQFEGIDVSQQSNWYTSNYGAFTAFALASDLSSGFSGAVGDNFVAASSSGGSSSGGGFGGGGGGSW
jgi:hypothetical protein